MNCLLHFTKRDLTKQLLVLGENPYPYRMCRILEALIKRGQHYPLPHRKFEIGRIVDG